MTTLEQHSTIPDDLIGMLDLLAETIVQALGFGVAVVNLARADGTMEVVSVAGDEDARSLLLGTADSIDRWRGLLEASEDWGRLRFQDHHHDLASADVFAWVPDMEMVDAEDAWHPEDALFAPLVTEDGTLLGVLSVDLPRDGLRPGLATRNALEAFAVSVTLAIEHATLRQRAERSEQAVLRQATHDPLTGLANRALLEERLGAALARDDEHLTAVVFIDLDRFKLVNDLLSHAVGDQVLCAVADRIVGCARPYDTAARWGGDEFLVLLEQLPSEAAALEVVRRITASLVDPVHTGDREVRVTVSMGVALVGPRDSVDPDELIRRADTAMYEIKSSGRDSHALFHAADRSTRRRRHLLDLLSRAVTEDRVVLHYQPLIRVDDRSIVGVEALLRLRDDDGSLVPPLDVLHLALEGGTLIPIEHEVIRQSCEQVARWVDDGHDLRLGVNVCAEQMRRIEDFEHVVHHSLDASGLDAARLVCELTEHHLVDMSEATVAGIGRLVEHGVRMSIDDFGTGFGSLTYLNAFPIHELKIDRSFVEGPERTSGAILRAIARLALELGMDCVAEGVETPEQHHLVRASGIPHAQGYLYARPVDPRALGPLLRSGLSHPPTTATDGRT
ncbi:putative bifunctional diguanylate cyclase/phosphodiesterase [Oryzobacter terrae]|uniref:putative bifunctional diguanylate cyclase/phosphodiesterase n=1 Tax=Oryzobacter terrae TaxID=1620385 RepID=UPI00366D593A